MILSHDMFRSIDGRYTELLITCTTSHIEASLLYFEDNAITKTLAHVRTPLGLTYPYNKEDVYEATYVALEDVCRAIALESHELFSQDDLLKDHQQIHRVRLFIGGPWVRKEFHTKSKHWELPHEITEEDVDEMLAQQIPQGYTRVANHITSSYANGYSLDTSALISQRVRDLELSYIDVFARVDLMETLFQVVHAELNIQESRFEYHATIAALAAHTQYNYQPGENYLALFVHGAHADVLLHNKGHVAHAGTLEWGYDQVIERILEQAIAPSRIQAISMLASYTAGYLDTQVAAVITEIVRGYVDELAEQIEEKAPGLVLPQDWYIFADEHIARFIKDACQSRTTPVRAVLLKPTEKQTQVVGLKQGMGSLAAIQSEYIKQHIHNAIEK